MFLFSITLVFFLFYINNVRKNSIYILYKLHVNVFDLYFDPRLKSLSRWSWLLLASRRILAILELESRTHCGKLSSSCCSVFLVISRDCLPFESNVSRAEPRFSWGFREMSVIHRDSLNITCNNDHCDIGDLSVGLEESIGIVLRTYFLRCSETKKVTSILSPDIYK